MPSSYDRFPTQITHHPTQRLDPSLSQLHQITPQEFVENFTRAMKVLTGIDITSSRAFFQWLKDTTGLDLLFLAGIDLDWSWVPVALQNLMDWVADPLAGSPNLLLDPEFRYHDDLGGPDWTFDTEVAHASSPAAGSRRAPADGIQHALRSNIISVAGLTAVEVRQSFLTGANVDLDTAIIALQLITFSAGTKTGIVDIDAFTTSYLAGSPPRWGDAGAWRNPPPGALAGDLYGHWSVPTDGSVDEVCLRCVITATGDNVWVDHARLANHGGLWSLLVAVFEAARQFTGAVWTAVMRWAFGIQPGSPFAPPADETFTFPEPVPADRYAHLDPADYGNAFSTPLWDWMCQHIDTVWHVMVREILDALDLELESLLSLSELIRSLLTENPVVGWLFKIGFAVTDWVGDLWTSVMRWTFGTQPASPYHDATVTGADAKPFSKLLWDAIVAACTTGFDQMVIKILEALGSPLPDDGNDRSLAAIIRVMLTENPVVGWLFKIGFAVTDWVGDLWTSVMRWTFGVQPASPYHDATVTGADAKPFSKLLWDAIVAACTTGFDQMVIKILEALGSPLPDDGNDRSLAAIIRVMLTENPVVGWLFKIGFAVSDFVAEVWDAIADWIMGDPAFPGTAADRKPFSKALWDSMVSRIDAAWTALLDAINDAIAGEVNYLKSIGEIIRAFLTENPVVGWLFKIGFAVTDFVKECWDSVADWMLGDPSFPGTAADRKPFSKALWDSLVSRWRAAWDVMVAAINEAIDGEVRIVANLIDMILDGLRNNPMFGWLIVMVEDWLRPVLLIFKAAKEFIDTVWQLLVAYIHAGLSSSAWSTLTAGITTAFRTLLNAVYTATRPGQTPAQIAAAADAATTPGDMLKSSLRNNPLFGWLIVLVEDWLQKILHVSKALIDFGDRIWQSLVVFFGNLNFTTLAATITAEFRILVATIFGQTRPGNTNAQNTAAAAALTTPGDMLKKVLQNNPVIGWVFDLNGFTAVLKDFFNAAWDYLLGGARYDGTTQSAWSKAAGAKLEAAWRALWAKVTGQVPAGAPTPGAAGAQSLWDGISTNFIKSALSGIWQPIGDYLTGLPAWLDGLNTALKNFFNAVWDYLLGGTRRGSNVGAFTTAAGARLLADWQALWAKVTGQAAGTAPNPGTNGAATVAANAAAGLLKTALTPHFDLLGTAQSVQALVQRVVNDLNILFKDPLRLTNPSAWDAAIADLLAIFNLSWTGQITNHDAVIKGGTGTDGGAGSDANNALVTQADPSIPNAPGFGFLRGTCVASASTASATVPYGTLLSPRFLYYCVTATKNGVESVISGEQWVMIMSYARVALTWLASTTPNCTYSVYRGVRPGEYTTRVATGLTGLSFTDQTIGGTAATPPTTPALAALAAQKNFDPDAVLLGGAVPGDVKHAADGFPQTRNDVDALLDSTSLVGISLDSLGSTTGVFSSPDSSTLVTFPMAMPHVNTVFGSTAMTEMYPIVVSYPARVTSCSYVVSQVSIGSYIFTGLAYAPGGDFTKMTCVAAQALGTPAKALGWWNMVFSPLDLVPGDILMPFVSSLYPSESAGLLTTPASSFPASPLKGVGGQRVTMANKSIVNVGALASNFLSGGVWGNGRTVWFSVGNNPTVLNGSTGSGGGSARQPFAVVRPFTSGATTFALDSRLQNGDTVHLTGIGGGSGGSGFYVFAGIGGRAGQSNSKTLTVGTGSTHIKAGSTIAVQVGAGGAGVWSNGDGKQALHNGGDTVFTYTTGTGATATLTCAGGVCPMTTTIDTNQVSGAAGPTVAISDARFSVSDRTIYGGAAQNSRPADGNPVGGGGSGAALQLQTGGAGARGEARILQRSA